MQEGIDVSRYQGVIDWKKAATQGISFAIVRAGYGCAVRQKDPYFEANIDGAAAAGLTTGCYWFSYAVSEQEAREEAQTCLAVLGGRRPVLGVWFDQEYVPAILALSSAQRTRIVQAFLAEMRAAGCTAGLYCSKDWLVNHLETARFTGENLWIAQYAPRLTAPLAANLWQYTGSGTLAGIGGRVDRDRLYTLPGASAPTPEKQPAAKAHSAVPAAAAPVQEQMPALGVEPLYEGTGGTAVEHLQQVLRALGQTWLPADGVFGPLTAGAVQAFQTAHGLAPDAFVGPLTRAALAEAWAARG